MKLFEKTANSNMSSLFLDDIMSYSISFASSNQRAIISNGQSLCKTAAISKRDNEQDNNL